MGNINIILFASGFVVAIISLIIMLVKSMKGNKVGIILPFIVIIGIGTLGSGVWLTIRQSGQENTSATNKSNNTNTTATNASTGNNQIKIVPFDANGSVVPNVTTDKWSRKIITDADGSKTILQDGGVDCINITPEGIRIFQPSGVGVIVQIPENKSTSDGKLYKRYGYGKDEALGKIHVSTGIEAVPDESSSDSKSIPGNDKEEVYRIGSSKDMSLINFVYQVIPTNIAPKSTTENNFLNGTYVGKEEKILDNQTTMSVEIIDDKLLKISSKYISNVSDKTYGYKFELLGKNAYKLYLYPTIKDEKGFFITDKPSKTTFIVYMKSQDSFDIVFIGDNIKRTSITMNKQ